MPEPEQPAAEAAAEFTAGESAILRILLSQPAPVGARGTRRLLLGEGLDLSEATVSRVFARLDAAGLTEAVGRKGRQLTPAGRRMTVASVEAARRSDRLERALEIRSDRQLLDLLHARRGVERELVRAAAENRGEQDLDRLGEAIAEQRRLISGGGNPHGAAMRFHRLIAEMSGNRLFAAIAATLWSDALAPLEMLLDIVTAGHGSLEHSAAEHESIRDALRDRDADRAEQAVAIHHSRLIDEVEAFAGSERSEILNRLFLSLDG